MSRRGVLLAKNHGVARFEDGGFIDDRVVGGEALEVVVKAIENVALGQRRIFTSR
jgi:hypothetical protein